MKSTLLWFLTGLNLLLAAVLVARIMPDNQAIAQNRRPSDYLMIPGNVTGLPYSVVFVIDQSNEQLGAIGYDDAQKKLQSMPAIDLKRMLEGGGTAVAPKPGIRK
jgi:hypothetical protein